MFLLKIFKGVFGVVSLIKKLVFLTILAVVLYFGGKLALKYYAHKKIDTVKTIIMQQETPEQFVVVGKKASNISVRKSQNNEGWLESLLFKHVVMVEGVVQVYYGYNLKDGDIKLDYDLKRNCVVLKMGKPEILTASIVFPIKYKTESGVIYKAFEEDNEKDVNDMLNLLKKNAIQSTEEWLKTQSTDDLMQDFVQQIQVTSKNKVKVCVE